MASTDNPKRLDIRRYPNRRFYDATHSRHATLTELYDLVIQGFDLSVTDSATGSDITHIVLTQMILERDAEKLAIFPAAILHQIIRTQTQFLGGVFENFIRQALESQRSTQDQWARFLQQTFSGMPQPQPTDWLRAWWGQPPPSTPPPPAPSAPAPPSVAPTDEVAALRAQLAALTRRLDELGK